MTLTLSEARAVPSWDEVRKLYLSLLSEGVSRNGTFDPSVWDIIDAFNDPDRESQLGDYTTTYSVDSDLCSDSVQLTIRVVADQEIPVCELSAGEDSSMELQLAEASAIPSWDEVRKLYLSLLDEGVPRNGEFDPSIWDLIDAFNDPDRESQLGDYTTTYTITDGECSDSVELTITVIPDFTDPVPCELDAGTDSLREMTESEAAAVPSWDEVRKLYLSLLDQGVPKNGEFDPSIWDLIDAFNDPDKESRLGDYTTTYTISNGECSDSVELTIRVVAD
ncbi:hypothetical protein ML462_11595 [Gramella lutea]|uniref:Uncharacterized protein n=1 Tax=Christiangramia lutea TaxID=1607951 RepID=A0A9X1V6G0_9FLAO|nr:hypothetical protein [Christiangramia lutea]MCH4823814.1 hypothetical protein [Christiangramia lutea]